MRKSSPSARAEEELNRAMRLHAEGRIDPALGAARQAIALDPSFANGHSYIGSTLVTRKRQYAAGLRELEQARDLAPNDPFIRYTLGWCYEYVAHDLHEQRRGVPGLPSSEELYQRAIEEFQACLRANPDDELRGDVIKLLGQLGVHIDE